MKLFASILRSQKHTTRQRYAMIIKYVQFLGYSENRLYHGLDVLPDKILQKIDSL